MLTAEKLKDILDYDPITGILTWKTTNSRKMKIGSIAGCLKSKGYIDIRINGKNYLAHRLAWLHFYGVWPKDQLNHKNTIKNDNSINNLEEVTHRQNSQRKKIHLEGKLVGVTWHKHSKKWQSRISLNNKDCTLGYYDTELEAHKRYVQELDNRGIPHDFKL